MSEKIITSAKHRCRAIVNKELGIPIVFLHGYSYTSEVWNRTGAVELLKLKKVPFLALDMPYGAKSVCQPRSRNVEVNIAFAKEATTIVFGEAAPVLLGASLGGHMALQYAARFQVKGLFLSAPVRVLEGALPQYYGKFTFPVHIIIGSEDRIASMEDLRCLVDKLPNAKLTVYQNEGHSAYLSSPDRFKRDLLELYANAEQAGDAKTID